MWRYEDDTWRDLLTSYDGQDITYDEIGNPITIGTTELTWLGRQLMSFKADGNEVTYAYNGDGQRVSKTYNGTTTEYFYNGEILAGQKTGDDVIVFMYDNNGDAFGFIYNETEYYYVKNAQNDIVAIADADGTVIANYYYDAWGYPEDITGNTEIANLNPLRYRSYYYDTESELYYLNSRYYCAEIVRFISPDTTDVLTASPMELRDKYLYAFCDNNPVVRVDLGGEFWDTIFDVVSLAVSVSEVIVNPSSGAAWAGLVADVVCTVVPGLTGGGAIVKVITKADDVVDTAKTIYKAADKASDIRKATGPYKIMYKSGRNYVGKGEYKRAINSAVRNSNKYSDKVVSISWKSAPNAKKAFMNEYIMQKQRGVLSSNRKAMTYNKIWSPGRNYFYQRYGRY